VRFRTRHLLTLFLVIWLLHDDFRMRSDPPRKGEMWRICTWLAWPCPHQKAIRAQSEANQLTPLLHIPPLLYIPHTAWPILPTDNCENVNSSSSSRLLSTSVFDTLLLPKYYNDSFTQTNYRRQDKSRHWNVCNPHHPSAIHMLISTVLLLLTKPRKTAEEKAIGNDSNSPLLPEMCSCFRGL